MSLNHVATRNSLHKLGKLEPSEEENGEETRTASRESTRGIESLTVEQRTDDETV
jgi:hypothetical protein